MRLELDHFFIMVDPKGKVADLLLALGMEESFGRDHRGQGTSNRRFELSNSMIELLCGFAMQTKPEMDQAEN